jgi:hypothetical protein
MKRFPLVTLFIAAALSTSSFAEISVDNTGGQLIFSDPNFKTYEVIRNAFQVTGLGFDSKCFDQNVGSDRFGAPVVEHRCVVLLNRYGIEFTHNGGVLNYTTFGVTNYVFKDPRIVALIRQAILLGNGHRKTIGIASDIYSGGNTGGGSGAEGNSTSITKTFTAEADVNDSLPGIYCLGRLLDSPEYGSRLKTVEACYLGFYARNAYPAIQF